MHKKQTTLSHKFAIAFIILYLCGRESAKEKCDFAFAMLNGENPTLYLKIAPSNGEKRSAICRFAIENN